MEYIYVCPKCGTTYGNSNKYGMVCPDCVINLNYSGFTDEEWYAKTVQERNVIKEQLKNQENKKIEEKKQFERQLENTRLKQLKALETEKETFAKSFNEYYEYDVVTLINQDHGQVDINKMMQILSDHARKGWRLHSIYSNELGKNALRVLGFGINSTACEDVMIFERRVEKV